MLNGSWKTGIVGYLMVAAAILGFIADSIAKQGLPNTLMEWFTFGTLLVSGIVGILAKDYNVSNAPTPSTMAKPVPPPQV